MIGRFIHFIHADDFMRMFFTAYEIDVDEQKSKKNVRIARK